MNNKSSEIENAPYDVEGDHQAEEPAADGTVAAPAAADEGGVFEPHLSSSSFVDGNNDDGDCVPLALLLVEGVVVVSSAISFALPLGRVGVASVSLPAAGGTTFFAVDDADDFGATTPPNGVCALSAAAVAAAAAVAGKLVASELAAVTFAVGVDAIGGKAGSPRSARRVSASSCSLHSSAATVVNTP